MELKLLLIFFVIGCVYSSSVNVGKIINGHTAQPHSAPYMISMRVRDNGSDIHWCGGSLIRKDWVLTAAHCIVRHVPVDLVAGDHDTTVIEAGEQRIRSTPNNMFVHDKYRGQSGPFDIALIRVTESFTETDTVKVISLPTKRSIPMGTGILFGWGNTATNSSEPAWPHKLQTADNPLIDYSICVQVWADGLVHPTNFCAGYLNGKAGAAACNADSGGPLVQYDDKHEVIYKIVWKKYIFN